MEKDKEKVNDSFNNITISPISDSVLERIKEQELQKARDKVKRSYDTYSGEEIVFDDINESSSLSGEVEIDSIIESLDMSDHRYRF